MSTVRTADFQDANKNGVDDRDEKNNEKQQGDQQQGGQDNPIYPGYINMQNILRGIGSYEPDKNDDEGRAMKNALSYNMFSKFFDNYLSKAQSEHNLGLGMEAMKYGSQIKQMEESNARKEEFSYGMRSMDHQFKLQDQFQNNEFGRDIGRMGAEGEQTRKNYAAQGQQNRLQAITEGEQQRLGYAAQGHQERKTMSHQDRINAGAEKRHTRAARSSARAF